MEYGLSTGLLLFSISMFTSMASIFFVIFVFSRTGRKANSKQVAPSVLEMPNTIVFLFAGTTLVDASPAALLYVGAPVDRNAVWEKLSVLLSIDFPMVSSALRALLEDEATFEVHSQDNSVLSGSIENGQLKIELKTVESSSDPTSIERSALEKQFQELALMRNVVEHTPMLVWRCNLKGEICWANKTYLDLLVEIYPETPSLVPPYQAILDCKDVSLMGHNRLSLKLPSRQIPAWFEILPVKQLTGETLYFAMKADPVVQAEEALRNFVQTLTKTFAHLSIGLAIFDRDRQLALFNPALSDLTTLEPAWLTARPTLTAFLDRLRECRHIPEPKDYKSWRDRIAALEKAAEDGTYEENWPLPTGQTYRVTGRPHPEGAVAFLFEDISSAISLQREFRAEIDLGQSVLDGLSDAVAVFSAKGELVASNDAFVTVWGVEPREMLARMTLEQSLELWRKGCEPSSVWQEIEHLAASIHQRQTGTALIKLNKGIDLRVQFKPIAGGAIMVEFTQEPVLAFQAEVKTLLNV